MTNRGVLSGLGSGDSPNVLSSDAGFNALLVAGGARELSGSAAANNTDLIASTDVRGYQSFCLQLTGFGSATVKVQGSNDNTNWIDQLLLDPSVPSPTATVNFTANGMRIGAVTSRYIRVRTTSYSSGTIVGTLELSPGVLAPMVRNISGINTGISVAPTTPQSSLSDSDSGASSFPTGLYGFAGTTGGFDRVRVTKVFKTVAATSSGNTALWTPASSRKFRLMGYRLELSADAATSGGALITAKFQDATTDMPVAHSVYVPAVSGTAFGNGYQPGWVDFGNGILSAAANNVLNVNISAALTSGTCRVMCAGVEE